MDRNTVLVDAQLLIIKAAKTGMLRGHLCFYEGKLDVWPTDHTLYQHVIFFQLHQKHFMEGLDNNEWDLLQSDLWNFFKERI